MLSLTRREGESVFLFVDGKTIEVHLHYADWGEARIAFDAPDDVQILREELIKK
jgi:carbon storage regulator CsrA